jgi:hypothetical protein
MSWSTSAQMAEKLLTGSGSAASSRRRYRIHKSMYPDRHGHQRGISPRLTDRTFSLVMVFPGDTAAARNIQKFLTTGLLLLLLFSYH